MTQSQYFGLLVCVCSVDQEIHAITFTFARTSSKSSTNRRPSSCYTAVYSNKSSRRNIVQWGRLMVTRPPPKQYDSPGTPSIRIPEDEHCNTHCSIISCTRIAFTLCDYWCLNKSQYFVYRHVPLFYPRVFSRALGLWVRSRPACKHASSLGRG